MLVTMDSWAAPVLYPLSEKQPRKLREGAKREAGLFPRSRLVLLWSPTNHRLDLTFMQNPEFFRQSN